MLFLQVVGSWFIVSFVFGVLWALAHMRLEKKRVKQSPTHITELQKTRKYAPYENYYPQSWWNN
jgi:hypothetical protein